MNLEENFDQSLYRDNIYQLRNVNVNKNMFNREKILIFWNSIGKLIDYCIQFN